MLQNALATLVCSVLFGCSFAGIGLASDSLWLTFSGGQYKANAPWVDFDLLSVESSRVSWLAGYTLPAILLTTFLGWYTICRCYQPALSDHRTSQFAVQNQTTTGQDVHRQWWSSASICVLYAMCWMRAQGANPSFLWHIWDNILAQHCTCLLPVLAHVKEEDDVFHPKERCDIELGQVTVADNKGALHTHDKGSQRTAHVKIW